MMLVIRPPQVPADLGLWDEIGFLVTAGPYSD